MVTLTDLCSLGVLMRRCGFILSVLVHDAGLECGGACGLNWFLGDVAANTFADWDSLRYGWFSLGLHLGLFGGVVSFLLDLDLCSLNFSRFRPENLPVLLLIVERQVTVFLKYPNLAHSIRANPTGRHVSDATILKA